MNLLEEDFAPFFAKRFRPRVRSDLAMEKLAVEGEVFIECIAHWSMDIEEGASKEIRFGARIDSPVMDRYKSGKLGSEPFICQMFKVDENESIPYVEQNGEAFEPKKHLPTRKTHVEYKYRCVDIKEGHYRFSHASFVGQLILSIRVGKGIEYEFRPLAGLTKDKPVWNDVLKIYYLDLKRGCIPHQGGIIEWKVVA